MFRVLTMNSGGEKNGWMDCWMTRKQPEQPTANLKIRVKMQKQKRISRILIWAPFKDIAFSLLFLQCCLSFLSFLISLSHAWTPAAEMRLGFRSAGAVMDAWLQAVAVSDLFAPGGRALRFHQLGLLFAGRFGSFAFLFLSWEWRVGARTRTVFERIWEERFAV